MYVHMYCICLLHLANKIPSINIMTTTTTTTKTNLLSEQLQTKCLQCCAFVCVDIPLYVCVCVLVFFSVVTSAFFPSNVTFSKSNSGTNLKKSGERNLSCLINEIKTDFIFVNTSKNPFYFRLFYNFSFLF